MGYTTHQKNHHQQGQVNQVWKSQGWPYTEANLSSGYVKIAIENGHW